MSKQGPRFARFCWPLAAVAVLFLSAVFVVEFAAPVHMVRAGWSKTSMKTGDDIVIDTHPSRNGAPIGITSTITFILKTVVNGQALPTRSE